jgi:hypothetical protein
MASGKFKTDAAHHIHKRMAIMLLEHVTESSRAQQEAAVLYVDVPSQRCYTTYSVSCVCTV